MISRRAQIGQTITTVPIFLFTIILLILFVVISSGFCILGKCTASDSNSSVSVRDQAVSAHILNEFFLTDNIEWRGNTHSVKELLFNLSRLSPDNKKDQLELFRVLQSHFNLTYGCDGANTLVIGRFQAVFNPGEISYSSNGIPVVILLDYPASDLYAINPDSSTFDSYYPLLTKNEGYFDGRAERSRPLEGGAYVQSFGEIAVVTRGSVSC